MAESTQSDPKDESCDEPFFAAESTPTDEPTFAPVEPSQALPPSEPVFEAVPAQTHGVSLPVDTPHSQVGWETGAPVAEPGTRTGTGTRTRTRAGRTRRRLGRRAPLWAGVAVVAIVALVALWFSLGRRTADEPALPTAPAAGVVGSALVDDAGEQDPAQAPTPLPDPALPDSTLPDSTLPDARLSAGMQVVVSNTGGQGIRLRAAPNTESLTLSIYEEGAPFLVLSPGGDYSEYPVEADGYFWYRIRVVEDPADQLVGWAAGDFLVQREQQ